MIKVRAKNFINALEKIADLLPLMSLQEFKNVSQEMYFSYNDVMSMLEFEETKGVQFISWDFIMNMFLP